MAHQQVCLRSIYCPWLPCLSQNSPRCACSCRDVGSQEHRSLRHVQVIGVYAFVIGMGVSFLFVTQSAHGTRFRRHSPMPWRGPSAYSGPASPDRLSSSRGICPHGSLGGLDVVQGLPSVHVHIVGIMAVRSSSDTALCFASLPPILPAVHVAPPGFSVPLRAYNALLLECLHIVLRIGLSVFLPST